MSDADLAAAAEAGSNPFFGQALGGIGDFIFGWSGTDNLTGNGPTTSKA
mgnify:CR=1 FL=1